MDIPKINKNSLKVQAARQVYSNQIVFKNHNKAINSTYAKQDFYFKVLASQVVAMAEQDNMNPVGQKFNFLG